MALCTSWPSQGHESLFMVLSDRGKRYAAVLCRATWWGDQVAGGRGASGNRGRASQRGSQMSELEAKFHEAMIGIYRRAKSEARYNAKAFLPMVIDNGGLKTAK